MKTQLTLLAFIAVSACSLAKDVVRVETVRFDGKATSKEIEGSLKGYASVRYVVDAKAGQNLQVRLRPTKADAYFDIMPPDDGRALHAGRNGDFWSGVLPTSGMYTINVYQMRSAARRGALAAWTIKISLE